MAVSSRCMRLLSPRLQCLNQTSPPVLQQTRCLSSSRYSNPSKRGFAAAPAQSPSFLGADKVQADQDGTPVWANNEAYETKRQYHVRRMRFAGVGLLASMAGLAMLVSMIEKDPAQDAKNNKRSGIQQLDASSETNARFQGKEVHVVGAGEDKRIIGQGQGQQIELVETGTSSVPHFPRTIYMPTSAELREPVGAQPNAPENPGNIDNQEEYTLVGLGIRTVMWIQVYVVGFYVRTSDISYLQEKLIHAVNPIASTLVPGEKQDLQAKLLDPTSSREIWNELLKVPGIKTAWRVSPTRNTDFGHLRDGFVTGIGKRTQEARKLAGGQETEFDAEEFGQSIQAFKGIFSGGKAPKGSNLIMVRNKQGALEVWFQAKPHGSGVEKEMQRLGMVPDERISKFIWLNYLAGEKVSSEAARKGVVDGLMVFSGRPIGSVEARVT